MKTAYEEQVAALAEASGAKIEIDENRVATMMVEGRVVQLKPSDEAESGMVAFTIVATAGDDGRFERGTLESALALNLFGAQTDKGSIGLFGDALFLSKEIALDGATPEMLAEKLLAFARLAGELARELVGDKGGDGEAAASFGGIGGFIQV